MLILHIWYNKYSKISNFSFWLVIKAGRHKMLVRKANREDPCLCIFQCLQKQSDVGLHCLSWPFWLAASIQNFRTFTVNGLSVKRSILIIRWIPTCNPNDLTPTPRSCIKASDFPDWFLTLFLPYIKISSSDLLSQWSASHDKK